MKKIKKNITIDGLASMVARGFENTSTKSDVKRLEDKVSSLDVKVSSLDTKVSSLDTKVSSLERGQEDIKLKLDNVAYRFELVELQRRVELLEKKVGAKR